TMSAPGWALAWATAARSEPAPPSARVVTWNVDGTMRASSASSPSRARAGFRTGAAGRPRPRNHFEPERKTDISHLQAEAGTRAPDTRPGTPLRRGPRGHGRAASINGRRRAAGR